MKLNLSVREITVSLLHELLGPVHTLFGSSEILRNKMPEEIVDQINALYTASENLKGNIEKFARNLNQEFDVTSSHSAALWFHELSSFCKSDVKIMADSLKQIQKIQEMGFKLRDPSLNGILGNMPKALDRLERYIEYFSTIKQEDLSVWDTEKLLRGLYKDDIPKELGK